MRKVVLIETPDPESLYIIPDKVIEALDNILNTDIDEWWVKDEDVSLKLTVIGESASNEVDPLVSALAMNAYYRGKAEGKLESIDISDKRSEEVTE